MATTPLQFMSLLTPQEQGTITAAALQSPPIMLFLLMLAASTEVTLADPRTAGGIAAMVGAGLLTQARADAITQALEAARPPLRTVVSSQAILGEPQADGSFWVTEVHTLSDGSVTTLSSLEAQGSDYGAIMAARAASLNAQFAQEAAGG